MDRTWLLFNQLFRDALQVDPRICAIADREIDLVVLLISQRFHEYVASKHELVFNAETLWVS